MRGKAAGWGGGEAGGLPTSREAVPVAGHPPRLAPAVRQCGTCSLRARGSLRSAISPVCAGKSAAPAPAPDLPPVSLAEENEERTMIDPTSKEDPKFKELVKVRREGANLWAAAL